MKTETKYRYQKRIKALETELKEKDSALYDYKQVHLKIYDTVTEVMNKGNRINHAWILEQYKRLFK